MTWSWRQRARKST